MFKWATFRETRLPSSGNLKRTHLENFFHHINNLIQNIKFTMEEESNGELAFLDTLLKQNNGEISEETYTY